MVQPNPNLLWQVRGIRSHRCLLSRFGPSCDVSVLIRPAAAAAAAGSGVAQPKNGDRPSKQAHCDIAFGAGSDLELLATVALSTGGGAMPIAGRSSLSPAPELPPPPRRQRSSRKLKPRSSLPLAGAATAASVEALESRPPIQTAHSEEEAAAAAAPAPLRQVLVPATVAIKDRSSAAIGNGDPAPRLAAKTTAARRTSRQRVLIEIAAAAAAMRTGRRRSSPRLRAGKIDAASSASTSASEDSSASPSSASGGDEDETHSDSDFSYSGESDIDTSSPSTRGCNSARTQSQQVIARASSKASSTTDKNAPVTKEAVRRRWTTEAGMEAVNSASRERQDPNRKLPASARRYTATTSKYIGVSFYKRVKRWETHIWGFKDKTKQIYIGSCSSEEAGARIYDRAYIKFRGTNPPNFPFSDYINEIPQWINLADDVFINMLRNMSRGKSLMWFVPELLEVGPDAPCPRPTRTCTKASTFPSVYRTEQTTWTALIRLPGRSGNVRLGTYDTEEEAARCHDRATIKLLGRTRSLNFKFEDYTAEMPRWAELSEEAFLDHLRCLGRARKRKLPPEGTQRKKTKTKD